MKEHPIERREFIKKSSQLVAGALLLEAVGCSKSSGVEPQPWSGTTTPSDAAVSVVKIKNGNIEAAVEQAIDLIGGMVEITKGRDCIMLKPNLVAESAKFTTKPAVVSKLASLMKAGGKEVCIGEGSAAAGGFNNINGEDYRTDNQELIDNMQQYVFDQLGYTALAKTLDVPLINLHSGNMVEVDVPGGDAFNQLTLHQSLTEIDLLCSVPMMKTHTLATVTLGMKNLLGLYPGTIYKTVRAWVHDFAADKGSPGVAYEILDMVKANKLGLTVIDGSSAMEGNGPCNGDLVRMDLIIAGTNPLATDMVAAKVMGFDSNEVPTFTTAWREGMTPGSLKDIEVRGEKIADVQRKFKRPEVYPWNQVKDNWGFKEM